MVARSPIGLAVVVVAGIASGAIANPGCSRRPHPSREPTLPAAWSSPGPLAQSHEALGCDACHVGDTPEVAGAKCLGCHTGLAARVRAGQGLHARAEVGGQRCTRCHADHRGRAFDPRGWGAMDGGEQGFDHALTGWPLQGKHAIDCARCHPARDRQGLRTYVGTDRACAACHANPHTGHLFGARACDACHAPTLASLRQVDFAHRGFELGAHREHACASCHTPALGVALPSTDCVTCHADESPHGARFAAFGSPPACGACHPSGSWRPSGFHHERSTGLSLWPFHGQVACRGCHRGASPDAFERFPTGTRCTGCHAHARVHADADHPNGRFTNDQCLVCHQEPREARVRPSVLDAHGVGSRFPLVGRHRDLRCAECHLSRGATWTDAGTPECGDRCHVDAHGGAKGTRCTTCHRPGTWVVPAP